MMDYTKMVNPLLPLRFEERGFGILPPVKSDKAMSNYIPPHNSEHALKGVITHLKDKSRDGHTVCGLRCLGWRTDILQEGVMVDYIIGFKPDEFHGTRIRLRYDATDCDNCKAVMESRRKQNIRWDC